MSKLEDIYNRYVKVMLYSADKVLGNMTLAEDAVQDAFMRIVNHPEHVLSIPIDDLKPYLIVVSENAARRIYKKQNKFHETPLNEADLFDSGQEDKMIEKLSIANIFNMPQMDSRFRDVIILKYYYDMSTRSIAKTLDISEANVRVRLARARNFFRDILERGMKNE